MNRANVHILVNLDDVGIVVTDFLEGTKHDPFSLEFVAFLENSSQWSKSCTSVDKPELTMIDSENIPAAPPSQRGTRPETMPCWRLRIIFISYRRDDSAIFTGRLYDRLADAYGAKAVFLDIHSIHTGDFRTVIAEHLRKSRVVLAIVGKDWLTRLKSADRTDGQEDYLRLEIEQAVEANCSVIPVYCDDIKCLSRDDLPSSLEPLAFANAIWPSFRVSQLTGQEMLPLMAEQFEEAWKKSKPADPNECQPQGEPK